MGSCSSYGRFVLGLAYIMSIVTTTQILMRHGLPNASACIDSERKSLTAFRMGLEDPFNGLSSWAADGLDCCKWRGVSCNNRTGYVVQLDLNGRGFYPLGGVIDPALLELKHLQFLDLSYSNFYGIPIPMFLGRMKELKHLNLSKAGFSGRIPYQLGNLSNLISLQLSSDVYYDLELVPHHALSSENLWWLKNLTSLEYLDMSHVNLSMASQDWVHVMNGSPSLVELRLPNCGLLYISPLLAYVNFTSLRVLDLSQNEFNSRIPSWIANVSGLVLLDLSSNRFHGPIPYQFSELPSLEVLRLGGDFDDLSTNGSEFLQGSWSRIKSLDLTFSHFYGGIPISIGNITSLVYFSLNCNESTTGSLPTTMSNLVSLQSLQFSKYHIRGGLPRWLGQLKNLFFLGFHFCNLTGPIPRWLGQLKNLFMLVFENCNLTGPIPETLGGLSSLQYLGLPRNQLSGTIPTSFGQLSSLTHLVVSSNNLTGNLSESVFENLTKLLVLDLSSNSFAFYPPPDWVPPFQAASIQLGSCHLGPQFPPWLQTQKALSNLQLPATAISGTIPAWFWDLQTLNSLDLSNNLISGQLPKSLRMQPSGIVNLSSNLFSGPIPYIVNGPKVLDLSNNQFSGVIPPNFISIMQNVYFFSASGNKINGKIPSSIGGMVELRVLDLSRNNISGSIPSRLGDCVELKALDLSGNHLSGGIPRSLGLLHKLETIHLNHNSLSGTLPSSLKNCTSLATLDLGGNKLSGQIPNWIGESFPGLRILRLRSNSFTGEIPPQLPHLTSLQVLDAAQNLLSGSIPQTIENLIAMKNERLPSRYLTYGGLSGAYYHEKVSLSAKGLVLEYTKTLSLVTCVDLSSNKLSGEIPTTVTSLLGMRILNLSGNQLIGEIPDKIGRLALLESLDFSRNHLSGAIPSSMSTLTFLSYLNLSHNNLSGRIPTGKQLQTLDDPSIYVGNLGLCGPPLTDDCDGNKTSPALMPTGGRHEEDNKMFWFYIGIGSGYVAGFWGFFGILLFKKSWRIAFFRFFDGMADTLFIAAAVWIARWKRRLERYRNGGQ